MEHFFRDTKRAHHLVFFLQVFLVVYSATTLLLLNMRQTPEVDVVKVALVRVPFLFLALLLNIKLSRNARAADTRVTQDPFSSIAVSVANTNDAVHFADGENGDDKSSDQKHPQLPIPEGANEAQFGSKEQKKAFEMWLSETHYSSVDTGSTMKPSHATRSELCRSQSLTSHAATIGVGAAAIFGSSTDSDRSFNKPHSKRARGKCGRLISLYYSARRQLHLQGQMSAHAFGAGKGFLASHNLLLLFYMTGFLVQVGAPLFIPKYDHDEWITYAGFVECLYWMSLLHNGSGALLFPAIYVADLICLVAGISGIMLMYTRTTALMKVEMCSCLLVFCCWNIMGVNAREGYGRIVWDQTRDLVRTDKRSDQLLKEMLPNYVLQNFKESKTSLRAARQFQDLTILFADISGFTKYAKSNGAEATVRLVTNLFSMIDDLSRRVGVYKVCTIGDCYVATLEPDALDVSESEQNESRRKGCADMFKFAAGLIYVVASIRDSLGLPDLGMRVGLHLGTVVGGVIGQRKLRYDIWGSDVLKTNKMEELGEVDRINVSQCLKDQTAVWFGPKRFLWTKGKYCETYNCQTWLMTHDHGLKWDFFGPPK